MMTLVEVDTSEYLPTLCRLFYLKHHLTKSALDHRLKILLAATKSNIKAISSPHNLFSKYLHLKTNIQKIFVCRIKGCNSELILDTKSTPTENQPCGHKYIANKSSNSYVLQLPIADQIKNYITTYHNSTVRTANLENPDFRGDIHSGDNYRRLMYAGLIDDTTITLQINTDGAQTF